MSSPSPPLWNVNATHMMQWHECERGYYIICTCAWRSNHYHERVQSITAWLRHMQDVRRVWYESTKE